MIPLPIVTRLVAGRRAVGGEHFDDASRARRDRLVDRTPPVGGLGIGIGAHLDQEQDGGDVAGAGRNVDGGAPAEVGQVPWRVLKVAAQGDGITAGRDVVEGAIEWSDATWHGIAYTG